MRARSRAGARLGLQIGLLVVALLVVVGASALILFERAEHADAERTLRQAAVDLDPDVPVPGFWVYLRASDGATSSSPGLPDALPAQPDLDEVVADGRPRQREVDAGDLDLFVRTEVRDGGVVQVAMDRTAAEESSGRLLTALILAGVIGVVLAAALAALLAHRALAPLSQALALQRRFVADAGHELRTPLTLLSTRVQMALRRVRRGGAHDPEVVSDLEGVLADTRALADILDDLLLSADGGAGRAACDLGSVVEAVVASAGADAEARAVRLVADVPAPVVVDGSEAALRRAVTALLDNALEHARSTVEVGCRVVRHRAEVAVTDDGPGVPEDHVARLFERFSSSRSGSPDSEGRRHYGLGLALVADVAEGHGGDVRVDRAAGGGSSFVMSLPLRRG